MLGGLAGISGYVVGDSFTNIYIYYLIFQYNLLFVDLFSSPARRLLRFDCLRATPVDGPSSAELGAVSASENVIAGDNTIAKMCVLILFHVFIARL